MFKHLIVFLSATYFVACASQAEKNVDQKLTQVTPAASPQAIQSSVADSIESTPGLTVEQKSKLRSLSTSTRSQIGEIRNESMKVQSLLLHEVFSEKSKASEIRVLKRKMKDLENKRLAVIFKSVDEARAILGKSSTESSQRIIHEFFYTPVKDIQ